MVQTRCRCPAGNGCWCSHPPLLNGEQLKGFFKRKDANHDGRLSRNELKNAFGELGAYFPGWRAGRALNHADGDGDGCISDAELEQLVDYALKYGYTVRS